MSHTSRAAGPGDLQALLAASGITAETPLAALDAVEPRWGAQPELEAAVVGWLGARGDAAAGPRLHALERRTSSRPVKREIRRALYRLAQRGLWSEPEAPAPPSTRELLGPAEGEPEAWLTPIDGTGTRLLWMARRAGDGLAILSAVVSDRLGVLDAQSGQTTRKALRKAQADLAARSGLSVVEAPWRHVDALLEQALERTADRSRLGDLAEARTVIASARGTEAGAPRSPIDALLDRAEVGADPAALAGSAEALREAELAGWRIEIDWLEPALEAVESAQSPLVVLGPAQQQERVLEALEKGLEAVFEPGERRTLYASRFEETAYLLARRGHAASARAVLAAALAIAAGRPVAEIPLLAEIARSSLGVALEARARRAQEDARSSLVVTPAQALAEERARRR